MAPEESGGGIATTASDQYSLAVVVFEMLTGRSFAQELDQAHGLFPMPRHYRPDLPVEAEAALLRALSPVAVTRFADVQDFAAAFDLGLRSIPPPISKPMRIGPFPAFQSPATGRRRLGIVSLGVSVLIVTALLIAILPRLTHTSTNASSIPARRGYDFTYRPIVPTTRGGTAVIGDWQFPATLSPIIGVGGVREADVEITGGLFAGCLVQLPDLTLGSQGWKADQCAEVPTVANGDESFDGLATTMKLDPRARWSDGQPITVDDYLLQYHFARDPNIGGDFPPFNQINTVAKVDDHTLTIYWKTTYAPYLTALWGPVPLHIYNAGRFAGLYNAASGAYNTHIAQQLIAADLANTAITITNGPFTVQSFAADDTVVLARNPMYRSNFFKGPFLDNVIFKTTGDKHALIQAYHAGQFDHIENFTLADRALLAGIPGNEVIVSPQLNFEHLEFNQRPAARNAKLNGGVSIFTDLRVRQAFVEAFDRCAALRAVLGITDCTDPSIAADELTAPPAIDYRADVHLPAPNLNDATALLDAAGYKIVNGVRRFRDGRTPMAVVLSSTQGNAARDSFLELMKEAYANLNIAVSIERYPSATYFAGFNAKGILTTANFDIALFAFTFSSDPGNQAQLWQSNHLPSATNGFGLNYVGLQDNNVDTYLAQGRQTLDEASRSAIYQELQRYMAQQFFFEPLYLQADIALTKSTLGNYQQSPAFTSFYYQSFADNTWNMADWYRKS